MTVVEPVVFGFFCPKGKWFSNFSRHHSPKGSKPQMPRFSDSIHLAICISSKLPDEATAAALGTTG